MQIQLWQLQPSIFSTRTKQSFCWLMQPCFHRYTVALLLWVRLQIADQSSDQWYDYTTASFLSKADMFMGCVRCSISHSSWRWWLGAAIRKILISIHLQYCVLVLIGCITNRNYRSNSLCKENLCLRKASTLCVECYWMPLSKADDFWSCALDRLDKPFLELLPALMGPSSFLPLFPALLDLPGKLLLYA